MKKAVSLAVLLAAGLVTASANTTFDTTPLWDGSSNITPFGVPNTTTYGQTFVAPTDNVMQDFTFYLNGTTGTTLSIQADVFAWSGSLTGGAFPQEATGAPLFQSASFVFSGNNSFQAVTVNTDGTVLTAGQNYIALFTVSNAADFANSNGTVSFGDLLFTHAAPTVGGGGGFNFDNNGSDFSALTTTPWDDFSDFGDLAWTAHFTAAGVPEPAAFGMLPFALGMIGMYTRRKKA